MTTKTNDMELEDLLKICTLGVIPKEIQPKKVFTSALRTGNQSLMSRVIEMIVLNSGKKGITFKEIASWTHEGQSSELVYDLIQELKRTGRIAAPDKSRPWLYKKTTPKRSEP